MAFQANTQLLPKHLHLMVVIHWLVYGAIKLQILTL